MDRIDRTEGLRLQISNPDFLILYVLSIPVNYSLRNTRAGTSPAPTDMKGVEVLRPPPASKVKTRLAFFVVLFSASLAFASCGRAERRTILSVPPSATLDNDIYLAEEGGRIRALRPDGSEQWSYSLAEDLERLSGQPSRDIRIDYLAARSGGHVFGL